jgi:hypothetical protein
VDLILSLVPQLKAGDEFILVGDGPVPFAEEASRLVPGVTYMHTPERTGDFGGTPLDYAIARARGDFIFFIGDDDLPVGHTFEVVRRGVRKSPMMPHVFAMLHSGNVLKNSVEPCRVSGQQLVFPRDLSRIPKYAECAKENMPLSDWVFIDRVVKAWGGVMFHEEIICILPRQNHGRMF